MSSRIVVAAIFLVLVSAVGWGASRDDEAPSQATGATGPDLVPMGPLPRDVVPLRYRLAFTIDPTKPRFSGHDEIDVKFAAPSRAIYLDGLDLNVQRVVVRLASGKTIAQFRGRCARLRTI